MRSSRYMSSLSTATSLYRAEMEEQFEHIVSAVGRPRSSTTLPSLCRLLMYRSGSSSGHELWVDDDPPALATFHGVCGVIETVDYLGCPRREGGDPVQVTVEDENHPPVPCSVIDVGDGRYRFWFRPAKAQTYRIRASLFGREIKNSPLNVEVVDQKSPQASAGSKGTGDNQLTQPTGVAANWDADFVYVLDSGNQRIVKYSRDLELLDSFTSPATEGRSATGICLAASGSSLWVANWKIRKVTEISTDDGKVIRSVAIPSLREPVDVAVNSRGHLLIADAEQSTVFIVSSGKNTIHRITLLCSSFDI